MTDRDVLKGLYSMTVFRTFLFWYYSKIGYRPYFLAKERTISRMEPYILNKTQRKNYGLWEWISRNVSDGDVLAYNFHPNMLGPLWNSRFSNKLIYIKAGKFENWVEKLEENNANYVLVLVQPRSMEHFWLSRLVELRNDPNWKPAYNKFRLEYSDSDYLVMRFNK